MAKNSNLHKAAKVKNDEFYTQLSDIENELKHYREHFRDKIIFCNCDDPEWSNFWRYFELNFDFFGLKKLISTHYETDKPSYKLELIRGQDKPVKTPLKQNGDFRSPECVELLKESDIVITNPPFSLWREYVGQLMEYKKKFVIIGNKNSIAYKEVFPLIKNNEIWLGFNGVKEFKQPDGTMKKFGNIGWFTNLDIKKRHEDIILFKEYTPEEYPKYDNFDAINVDKVSDIPCDYDGVMGVPVSIMDKYNPDQFEICGMAAGNTRATKFYFDIPYTPHKEDRGGCGVINGKRIYTRIFIKHKEQKGE